MNQRKNYSLRTALAAVLTFCAVTAEAADRFVSFNSGTWLLNNQQKLSVYVDGADQKGVARAATNMAADLKKVTGCEVMLGTDEKARIVVGTIGHSKVIDQLVRNKKIDVKALKGKHEKYLLQRIGDQLVIAGSDRRGAIYGAYELSKQIGVSPWYYWADVPVEKHGKVYIADGVYTDNEPAVAYRGIFINDEAPCLTSWTKNTFHTDYGGHEMYEKVFELILRLKGNYLWPAMWGWAFYADDPENGKLADEMGVMIGTSHHEPMARNHQEYARNRKGWGAWNYRTNKENLDKFFREGIERMKGTEDVVTIGMRGDGDEAMGAEADTKLMEDIVANQRKIIEKVTGKKASETPQLWALYKEVLDYYDKGMKVPEDVIIMLCDDNWGNVRRVPSAKDRNRKGGWGLYYHVDYVGAPRNSKWLNVTQPQSMWEQLNLAYEYGINKMWILNVGDIKPMEYPITQFLDMAWNPNQFNADNIVDHERAFCAASFGDDQADEAARILNLYTKYNSRCTAEMLDSHTYNVETGEWTRVAAAYQQLENEALRQFITLKPEYRDAYQQLVLFPVQAMSNLYQMYYAQAMNEKLFKAGDARANKWADRVAECFRQDSLLMAGYNHDIANGKWNGMMTQKHIGYTSWNDAFPKDMMPKVNRIAVGNGSYVAPVGNGYVAIDAENNFNAQGSAKAQWKKLPYHGRCESSIALMPYTEKVDGAFLEYAFKDTKEHPSTVKVHVIVKSTLDYLNKGGLTYEVSLDGCEAVKVNFNDNLNEAPENIYNIYYPTIARRVVEKVITLPYGTSLDTHILKFVPNDPGIVLEKIVVDFGGYQSEYLFGE